MGSDTKLKKYLRGALKNSSKYYVDDIPKLNDSNTFNSKESIDGDDELSNFKDFFDYIFILESPHTDEVENKKNRHPLAGKSGKSVANFLLRNDKEESFGKIVKDSYDGDDAAKECANTLLNNKKVAIVNVSNVPLQVIEANKENVEDTKGIKDKLKKIRDNAIKSETEGSIYLLELFIKKLNKYISSETKNLTIIVCGDFARKYFDAIYDDEITVEKQTETYRKEIKEKIDIIKNEKKLLYVPHPSRNQWQFIDMHQINLNQLKGMFNAN